MMRSIVHSPKMKASTRSFELKLERQQTVSSYVEEKKSSSSGHKESHRRIVGNGLMENRCLGDRIMSERRWTYRNAQRSFFPNKSSKPSESVSEEKVLNSCVAVKKRKLPDSRRTEPTTMPPSFESKLERRTTLSSFDGKKTLSATKKRKPDQRKMVRGVPMEKRYKKSMEDDWYHQENLFVGDGGGAACRGTVFLSSQVTTTTPAAAATDAFPTSIDLGLQISPKKSQRAPMMKTRFADIIKKSQGYVHGDKSVGAMKIQQPREASETKLREETVKYEARMMKASETLEKLKGRVELKRRWERQWKTERERDRKAARIALQNMENTAGIELNLEIEKELMVLAGGALCHRIALQQLGLFIKNEYLEEDDDAALFDEELEEGEIRF